MIQEIGSTCRSLLDYSITLRCAEPPVLMANLLVSNLHCSTFVDDCAIATIYKSIAKRGGGGLYVLVAILPLGRGTAESTDSENHTDLILV